MRHVIRSIKVAAVIACLCLGLVSSGSRAQQNNTISATNFTFQTKLTANDGTAESFFGAAVAISGDTAIAFAQNAVYVFVRSGNTWTQQAKLIPSDGIGVATSSNTAAISGDTVVIGGSAATINSNTSQGAAYVFIRNGTTWTEQQRLTASDGAAQDQFGSSVSINGDSIIVGAVKDDVGSNTDQGAAYVYFRQGGAWTEQAKLVANDGAANGLLGQRVSISGDTVAVSTSNFSPSSVSHAYVFFRSGTNWSQQANVSVCEPHSPNIPCRIASLAVNGDTLIFGDQGVNIGNNTFQGAAYVFIRSGTTWSQQQRLTASDGQTDDAFGRVAIEGDTVVVGSRAAYVFTRSGSVWTEQQKLQISGGGSVSISGNTILVGVASETINGNMNQGSVYVFVAPVASTVQFSAANYNIGEGGGSVTITVHRTGDTSGASSVDFVTCDGSATQAQDYVATSGTLSFGSGETSKTFNVVIVDDAIVDPNETLNLTLSNATGATLALPGTATVTITDNDIPRSKKTGVFRPSTGELFLKNVNSSGFADTLIVFGNPGDYPIAGDWDGDGVDSVGIYRSGAFYLRNTNSTGFADIVVPFGDPGDQPVVGDWNGDGIDTIGIYRNGNFLLRNSNTPGPPDLVFTLGDPGDVGIAGDWNGDGIVTCGVFRPSNGVVYLKNTNTTGFADLSFVFGIAGDKPVAGDWNGDGIDTVGIYRNGLFYLTNSNTTGFADIVFALGINGDFPIAGNWNGSP